MKRAWIWIIAAVVIAVAIGGFLWNRRQRAQQAQSEILREAKVIRDDLRITVAASGNVVANQKAELRFEIPGTVAQVHVEVGDRVEQGDVLATLDAEALELALEEAETRLEEAQTENARQIEEAQLSLETAQLRLEQAELRVPGLGSASAAVRSARANLARVKQGASAEDIAIAERQLEQAKNALWQQQIQRDATCGAVGLTTTQDQCDAAQAAVQQAEESVRIAQLQLEKMKQGPSAEDVESAEAQLAQAQSEYARAADENAAQEIGLEILKADVTRAELTLKRLQDGIDPSLELAVERARNDLAKATLVAPFGGIVSAVNLQVGVQANTTLPAVTLVDDSVFFVDVTVDEIDIGKVAQGQPVAVTVDAYPNTVFRGEIETIGPAPSNVGGVVAYPVRVRLVETDNEDAEIRDGMTASVLIETSMLEDVLLIPNWAVRTDQSSAETYTYCYCLQNGVPKRTPITIGERNETYTQVLSGLEAGDTVVLVTEQRNLFEFSGGPPSTGD
ncbi:MAG: efflux RND transporter periplasmic adaptor subunit [Anaerolineae bacterium]